MNNEIPESLKNIAHGRDYIKTSEFCFLANCAQQTIRRHLWQYGHFYGLVPKKFGSRLQWAVKDVAKFLSS